MSSLPRVRLLSCLVWSMAVLLACNSVVAADPKPLTKEEQNKIDKAIDKGVAFLKKTQTKRGDWPGTSFYSMRYAVAHCALPAYALLESGVAADDPAIQKAAAALRRGAIKTPYTYEVSLALLFFDRLGDAQDKKLIQSLGLRLVAGQCQTGGWGYRIWPIISEKHEAPLLKALQVVSARMEGKSSTEAESKLEVPLALRRLTVFQDPRTLAWEEEGDSDHARGGTPYVGITDNSNTQFAVLGLWAAQRHDVPMKATFRAMVERFERCQLKDGGWPYAGGYRGNSLLSTRSMTCAGLQGLAIGRGEKIATPGSAPPGRADVRVLRGLLALSEEIGPCTGSMNRRVPQQDLYFLWSLERVGMLYNLPLIGGKDWYRWGAEILLTNQLNQGSWPGAPFNPRLNNQLPDYGPALNTAFALLFLKRSHPLKELTAKLPFTPKELNQGIACLLNGDALPTGTENPPASSKDKKP